MRSPSQQTDSCNGLEFEKGSGVAYESAGTVGTGGCNECSIARKSPAFGRLLKEIGRSFRAPQEVRAKKRRQLDNPLSA
jgi:hypothetical protein